MTKNGDKQHGQSAPEPNAHKVACAEIQSLLLDYLAHELGEARAVLVREHMRKCPACQAAAAEIQSTLAVLQGASREATGVPSRLSERRRSRLRWALAHPVMHWIARHHVLVSLVVAVVVVVTVFLLLRDHPIWKTDDGRQFGVQVLLTPGSTPPADTEKTAP